MFISHIHTLLLSKLLLLLLLLLKWFDFDIRRFGQSKYYFASKQSPYSPRNSHTIRLEILTLFASKQSHYSTRNSHTIRLEIVTLSASKYSHYSPRNSHTIHLEIVTLFASKQSHYFASKQSHYFASKQSHYWPRNSHTIGLEIVTLFASKQSVTYSPRNSHTIRLENKMENGHRKRGIHAYVLSITLVHVISKKEIRQIYERRKSQMMEFGKKYYGHEMKNQIDGPTVAGPIASHTP